MFSVRPIKLLKLQIEARLVMLTSDVAESIVRIHKILRECSNSDNKSKQQLFNVWCLAVVYAKARLAQQHLLQTITLYRFFVSLFAHKVLINSYIWRSRGNIPKPITCFFSL